MALRSRAVLVALACLATTGAAPQTRYSIALALQPGMRFAEYRFVNDRIEWKLPKKRLEPFLRAGVVIHEERHIQSTVRAQISALRAGVAMIAGRAAVNDVDVARHRSRSYQQTFSSKLTPRNETPGSVRPDIEDALMEGLPDHPLRLGDCWLTTRAVMTTLGSGNVVIRHCLESRDGGLLRIAVQGDGQITGHEYDLPKLLPGTIAAAGMAWYDLDQRLVTLESYHIHNRLLKPAEGEQIGFDELLDVDITTRRI